MPRMPRVTAREAERAILKRRPLGPLHRQRTCTKSAQRNSSQHRNACRPATVPPGRLQAVRGRERQRNCDNQRQLTTTCFPCSGSDSSSPTHISHAAEHPLKEGLAGWSRGIPFETPLITPVASRTRWALGLGRTFRRRPPLQPGSYSKRNACIGLTKVARRAGNAHAISATRASAKSRSRQPK